MEQAKVIEHGIVYRNTVNPFSFQGWPSVCRADDGALIAVWSGFRLAHVCPFGKTAMSKSYDEGATWSSPAIINDTPLDDRDAGILNTGNGGLLITWFCHPKEWMVNTSLPRISANQPPQIARLCEAYAETYKLLTPEQGKGGCFIRNSRDNGVTWGETIMLPISSPHGPSMLSDGSVLYLGKEHFVDTANIAAYRSTDKGETWSHISTLKMPEGMPLNLFHEPHCIELPDGNLLGAIRVHGDDYFSVYLTRSADKGMTWTIPEPLIPNGASEKVCGSPPHLLLHSSGTLICCIGRRTKPFGEHALVSNDFGYTWEELVLDTVPPGDLGYPASVELTDGNILTLYYQKYGNDSLNSILYTKWTI